MSTRLPVYRRMRRRFYHGLAVLVLAAVRSLPPAAGRAFCAGLARLALRLRRRERKRALINLERALPGLAPVERQALLGRATVALGKNFFEALSLSRHRTDDFAALRDGDGADGAGEEPDDAQHQELGDLLFSLVNVARRLRIDPEAVTPKASISDIRAAAIKAQAG